MALTAANVLEVRTGAGVSDNNGAAFDPTSAGTDRSQQNSPQVAIDNSTITTSITTNVITFTGNTYTVLAGDVGNVVQMLTGTNVTPAFYRITSVSAGLNGSWTVDSNVVTAGTTTNATGNMGGALASPGKAAGAMVSGNALYCASGTYSFTSTSSNVAAGMCSFPVGTTTRQTYIEGYGSSRGDGGTKPLWQASGAITSFTMVVLAQNCFLNNISIDGASKTSSQGASNSGGQAVLYKCKVANCKNSGFLGNSSASLVYLSEFTGCSGGAACDQSHAFGSVFHDNTVIGFRTGGNSSVSFCISCNNTGALVVGFQFNGGSNFGYNLTSYGNSSDGFKFGGVNAFQQFTNCIAENNGGYGFNSASAMDGCWLFNCGGYNNTSGNVNTSLITSSHSVGFVTGTAEMFVAPGSNNFALNNNAGGGALFRAAGMPGAFNSGMSTTGYLDIGAAQSQGGSGSVQGFVYIRGR